MKAVWNGHVVAESDDIVTVEGNAYFPADSVHREFARSSEHTTHCPWKGEAHYLTLEADGKSNPDSVWFYPEPKPAAAEIRGRVAFWKGVRVEA